MIKWRQFDDDEGISVINEVAWFLGTLEKKQIVAVTQNQDGSIFTVFYED